MSCERVLWRAQHDRPDDLTCCVRLVKRRGEDRLEPLRAGKRGVRARQGGGINAVVVAEGVDTLIVVAHDDGECGQSNLPVAREK